MRTFVSQFGDLFPAHDDYRSIVAKLGAAGWQQDLDFLGVEGLADMANMPVVRQSSKLTEGGMFSSYVVVRLRADRYDMH